MKKYLVIASNNNEYTVRADECCNVKEYVLFYVNGQMMSQFANPIAVILKDE